MKIKDLTYVEASYARSGFHVWELHVFNEHMAPSQLVQALCPVPYPPYHHYLLNLTLFFFNHLILPPRPCSEFSFCLLLSHKSLANYFVLGHTSLSGCLGVFT